MWRRRQQRVPLPAAAAGILSDLRIVRPLEFAVRLRTAAHVVGMQCHAVTPPGHAVKVSVRLRPARVVLVRRAALHSTGARVTIKRNAPRNPFGTPDRPDPAGLRACMPESAAVWDDVVAHFGIPARIHLTEGGRVVEWEARR